MKYRLLCFFICLGIYVSVNAQENSLEDNAFIQELGNKTSSIRTIPCKFTQIQSISVLSNKIMKSGRFYYQRPEQILLMFNNGDYIKMTSENFIMKNGNKTNEIKVESNPMLRELKKILSACMTGEVINATKEFQHSLKREKFKYTVVLTPKKKRAASKIKEIMLEFDRGDMCLNKMKMTQPNGDYTLYEFFEKNINVPIRNIDK